MDTISTLINNLKEHGTVVLSGQNVRKVYTIPVDTQTNSNNEEIMKFELPKILRLAGFIKSNWKVMTASPEANYKSTLDMQQAILNGAPYIDWPDTTMELGLQNYEVKVHIADEEGNPKLGLVKLQIYIHDDATEAAAYGNLNRSADNILCDSQFDLYYVVHGDYSEATVIEDTNLYTAIKEQLTGGQTINPDLISYPYRVNRSGEVMYADYYYDRDGSILKLYENRTVSPRRYVYQIDEETGVVTNLADNTEYSRGYDYVKIESRETSTEGVVTLYEKIRLPSGKDSTVGQDMYIAAYDNAMTFVISDSVLFNKITSLLLNNRQIRDLSGIENFVGLTSDLNVSQNYLDSIQPIYDLDAQKAAREGEMRTEYLKWLRNRSQGNLSKSINEIKSQRRSIKSTEESLVSASKQIIGILKEAAQLVDPDTLDNPKAEDYEKYEKAKTDKVTAINKVLDKIYGCYDEDDSTKWIKGYMETLDEQQGKLDTAIAGAYSYLEKLYDVYNNEYRLTTLLADSLNYLNGEEYDTYYENTHSTTDAAVNLVRSEISYLTSLEAADALNDLDKALLQTYFSNAGYGTIAFGDPDKTAPLAEFFSELMDNVEFNRVGAVRLLNGFREIAIYSEMASYCQIKRMNETTVENYCYEYDYIETRIKDLEIDGIPTDIESKVLGDMNAFAEDGTYTANSLYGVYREYKDNTREYKHNGSEIEPVEPCEGPYKELNSLIANTVVYDADSLKNAATRDVTGVINTAALDEVYETSLLDEPEAGYIGTSREGRTLNTFSKINYVEQILERGTDYQGEEDDLLLFTQLISLSEKLLTANVNRYVYLERLKKLDVSYNADLDDLEGITALANTLSDLNAAYCYIADVSNVDWAQMKNLKRLNLANNFIKDIRPLSALKDLKYLNVSNNLLEGELQIRKEEYEDVYTKLEELDLSGNQLTDITDLLKYLDHITGGNYANYIAESGKLKVDLSNQRITINVPYQISLEENPTTVNVELPKIFNQLLRIDVNRTAFGETSQNGRIESEGKYVTLNTRTTGDKVGTVVVTPRNGVNPDIDNCVGKGTTATINYTVVDRIVPDPTNPDPTNPDPTNPDPTNPDPTNPDPTNPDPTNPDPTNPDPTNPDPTNPDPTNPDPTNPDPTNPDPTNSNIDVGYPTEETYLKNIKAQTPINEFKKILVGEENVNNYNVVVMNENENGNNDIVTTGIMKTGMLIKVQDQNGNIVKDKNGNEIAYEVIVKGDINGDGIVNSVDSKLVKAIKNEVGQFSDAAVKAADVNGDSTVNVTDAKYILYHRAEVPGYNLNY